MNFVMWLKKHFASKKIPPTPSDSQIEMPAPQKEPGLPWFEFNPRSFTAQDSLFWAISTAFFSDKWKSYDVIGLDLFDAKYGDLKRFKDAGKKLIAYTSIHFENWRPDAESFPDYIKVQNLGTWSGEKIIDVRWWEAIQPIFSARFRLAIDKGFDALELDNTDQRAPHVSEHQMIYHVKRLVALAGEYGLKVFQKNTGGFTHELQPLCAGVIAESCNTYGECFLYKTYSDNKKPVWMIEYDRKNFKHKTWGQTYLASRILDGQQWE